MDGLINLIAETEAMLFFGSPLNQGIQWMYSLGWVFAYDTDKQRNLQDVVLALVFV